MHRRRGTGQVVDLFGLQEQRLHDVVPNQLEPRMVDQAPDVLLAAGEEIVDADHLLATLDQPLTKMAAQEPGTTGD